MFVITPQDSCQYYLEHQLHHKKHIVLLMSFVEAFEIWTSNLCAPSLYDLWNEIQEQNLWVESFSCTLVANWVTTKKSFLTFFVSIFKFVNYTIK
jgi:hypothetical protein